MHLAQGQDSSLLSVTIFPPLLSFFFQQSLLLYFYLEFPKLASVTGALNDLINLNKKTASFQPEWLIREERDDSIRKKTEDSHRNLSKRYCYVEGNKTDRQ